MARLASAGLLVAASVARAEAAPPGAAESLDIRQRAGRQEERLLARASELRDPALDAYLASLVTRLVPGPDRATDLPAVRAVILRDPAPGAFSLPHGRIYLSTGLLARVEGEAELAMVLAREIAHLLRSDAARAAQTGRPAAPPHAYAALGLDLAYTAAVTGYGAEAEREADAEAVNLLTRAGFDVEVASRAFDQLRRGVADDRRLQGFLLGTVRFLDERRGSLAVRGQDRPEAPLPAHGKDEFARALRVAVRDNALLEGGAGRFVTARAQLARALRLAPGDPVAHLYAGDLDRLEAQRAGSGADRRTLRHQSRIAYERAALLAPEWPQPYQRLGLLHYEAGNVAAAREAFARYLTLAPDDPEARRIREYLAALDSPRR